MNDSSNIKQLELIERLEKLASNLKKDHELVINHHQYMKNLVYFMDYDPLRKMSSDKISSSLSISELNEKIENIKRQMGENSENQEPVVEEMKVEEILKIEETSDMMDVDKLDQASELAPPENMQDNSSMILEINLVGDESIKNEENEPLMAIDTTDSEAILDQAKADAIAAEENKKPEDNASNLHSKVVDSFHKRGQIQAEFKFQASSRVQAIINKLMKGAPLGEIDWNNTDKLYFFLCLKNFPLYSVMQEATKVLTTRDWNLAREEMETFKVLDLIERLKENNLWSFQQGKKFKDPPRRKCHRDYLLDGVEWMSVDFAEERRWKLCISRELAHQAVKELDSLFPNAQYDAEGNLLSLFSHKSRMSSHSRKKRKSISESDDLGTSINPAPATAVSAHEDVSVVVVEVPCLEESSKEEEEKRHKKLKENDFFHTKPKDKESGFSTERIEHDGLYAPMSVSLTSSSSNPVDKFSSHYFSMFSTQNGFGIDALCSPQYLGRRLLFCKEESQLMEKENQNGNQIIVSQSSVNYLFPKSSTSISGVDDSMSAGSVNSSNNNWLIQEDDALTQGVVFYKFNWSIIADHVNSICALNGQYNPARARSGEECRQRYFYLNSNPTDSASSESINTPISESATGIIPSKNDIKLRRDPVVRAKLLKQELKKKQNRHINLFNSLKKIITKYSNTSNNNNNNANPNSTSTGSNNGNNNNLGIKKVSLIAHPSHEAAVKKAGFNMNKILGPSELALRRLQKARAMAEAQHSLLLRGGPPIIPNANSNANVNVQIPMAATNNNNVNNYGPNLNANNANNNINAASMNVSTSNSSVLNKNPNLVVVNNANNPNNNPNYSQNFNNPQQSSNNNLQNFNNSGLNVNQNVHVNANINNGQTINNNQTNNNNNNQNVMMNTSSGNNTLNRQQNLKVISNHQQLQQQQQHNRSSSSSSNVSNPNFNPSNNNNSNPNSTTTLNTPIPQQTNVSQPQSQPSVPAQPQQPINSTSTIINTATPTISMLASRNMMRHHVVVGGAGNSTSGGTSPIASPKPGTSSASSSASSIHHLHLHHPGAGSSSNVVRSSSSSSLLLGSNPGNSAYFSSVSNAANSNPGNSIYSPVNLRPPPSSSVSNATAAPFVTIKSSGGSSASSSSTTLNSMLTSSSVSNNNNVFVGGVTTAIRPGRPPSTGGLTIQQAAALQQKIKQRNVKK